MKKILLPLAGLLTLGLVAGCNDDATNDQTAETGEKLTVVTTVYPLYDWASQIVGDNENVEVKYLLSSGVDVHSFQASSQDIVTIGDADMVLYVGGESDIWVEDILETSGKDGQVALNLMEVLGDDVKMEEMVEGMQVSEHNHDHEGEEHDHEGDDHDHEGDDHDHEGDDHDHEGDDHDHEGEEHDHEDGDVEADEHIWLSLENAEILCEAIADGMAQIDGNNAATYQANVEAYIAQLDALDEKYEVAIENSALDTILVADRFPFRYLVDDYDLDYYAAFVGCSAETEASFETIAFLAGKLDELGLHSVLTIENSDARIADTVIASSASKDQQILVLNSLQSINQQQIDDGVSYLKVMEDNLNVLAEALK